MSSAKQEHECKVASLEVVMGQATPDEVIAGMNWYNGANREVRAIASDTGLSVGVVAAVFGALSPRNKWERNIIDAGNMCRAYVKGLDLESISVCTFNRQKRLAAEILRKNDPSLLSGPKVTAFALMVADPNADLVVIDSHAYNACKGDTLIQGGNGPTVTPRRFERCAAAYTEIAKRHGIKAHQAQAIIWLVWKRLNNL